MAQIADKDTFADLTDKQKRVVNELVNDPFAQNTVIKDRADVSRSTVHNVKEHYPHIIETQLNARGRAPGEETTEGDPYDGEIEFTKASQMIGDRPVQPETTESADGRVAVELPADDVRAVLAGEDPERVRALVMDAVVSQATTGS